MKTNNTELTGQKTKPMILSSLRKGRLDVPFMFVMNAVAGADGIPWAAPIADALAMLIALILFVPYWKQVNAKMDCDTLISNEKANDRLKGNCKYKIFK